jgi:hypothetical protein
MKELKNLVENILSEDKDHCIEVLVGNDDPDYHISNYDFKIL